MELIICSINSTFISISGDKVCLLDRKLVMGNRVCIKEILSKFLVESMNIRQVLKDEKPSIYIV